MRCWSGWAAEPRGHGLAVLDGARERGRTTDGGNDASWGSRRVLRVDGRRGRGGWVPAWLGGQFEGVVEGRARASLATFFKGFPTRPPCM